MDSAGPNNLSFKYQVFTPLGLQEIIKFEFVAKTQFLCMDFTQYKIYTQPITPLDVFRMFCSFTPLVK